MRFGIKIHQVAEGGSFDPNTTAGVFMTAIMDSVLRLYGVADNILWYDELLPVLYGRVFHIENIANIQIILEDLREQRDRQEQEAG